MDQVKRIRYRRYRSSFQLCLDEREKERERERERERRKEIDISVKDTKGMISWKFTELHEIIVEFLRRYFN